MKLKHPIQPLARDADGALRFKKNEIVRFLLDWSSRHGMDLNDLQAIPFADDERQQFAQLIGYTLGGYGELSYVDDKAFDAAESSVKQHTL